MPGTDASASPAEASWAAFATGAPALAERVRARFAANLHHVIGTVRPNGAPRLSGTEIHIGHTDVTLGMMAGSRKLADVRRDARVEIHSAPLEADLREGDARLTGRLVELDDGVPHHPGAGAFTLLLARVALVTVQGDELVVTSWRPAGGIEVRRRR